MIDDPAIGRILGPNLTAGSGGVTAGFRPADWDRIVRHGIKHDGKPALMPSEDFRAMSDQELSDIIAFIRAQPPVDREVPRPSLGPIGKVLVATGKFRLSADLIGAEGSPHAATPPKAEPTVAFGRHVAGTCMGCHREDLGGGPIVGGDPSWPPAANLTSGPGGIGELDARAVQRGPAGGEATGRDGPAGSDVGDDAVRPEHDAGGAGGPVGLPEVAPAGDRPPVRWPKP